MDLFAPLASRPHVSPLADSEGLINGHGSGEMTQFAVPPVANVCGFYQEIYAPIYGSRLGAKMWFLWV